MDDPAVSAAVAELCAQPRPSLSQPYSTGWPRTHRALTQLQPLLSPPQSSLPTSPTTLDGGSLPPDPLSDPTLSSAHLVSLVATLLQLRSQQHAKQTVADIAAHLQPRGGFASSSASSTTATAYTTNAGATDGPPADLSPTPTALCLLRAVQFVAQLSCFRPELRIVRAAFLEWSALAQQSAHYHHHHHHHHHSKHRHPTSSSKASSSSSTSSSSSSSSSTAQLQLARLFHPLEVNVSRMLAMLLPRDEVLRKTVADLALRAMALGAEEEDTAATARRQHPIGDGNDFAASTLLRLLRRGEAGTEVALHPLLQEIELVAPVEAPRMLALLLALRRVLLAGAPTHPNVFGIVYRTLSPLRGWTWPLGALASDTMRLCREEVSAPGLARLRRCLDAPPMLLLLDRSHRRGSEHHELQAALLEQLGRAVSGTEGSEGGGGRTAGWRRRSSAVESDAGSDALCDADADAACILHTLLAFYGTGLDLQALDERLCAMTADQQRDVLEQLRGALEEAVGLAEPEANTHCQERLDSVCADILKRKPCAHAPESRQHDPTTIHERLLQLDVPMAMQSVDVESDERLEVVLREAIEGQLRMAAETTVEDGGEEEQHARQAAADGRPRVLWDAAGERVVRMVLAGGDALVERVAEVWARLHEVHAALMQRSQLCFVFADPLAHDFLGETAASRAAADDLLCATVAADGGETGAAVASVQAACGAEQLAWQLLVARDGCARGYEEELKALLLAGAGGAETGDTAAHLLRMWAWEVPGVLDAKLFRASVDFAEALNVGPGQEAGGTAVAAELLRTESADEVGEHVGGVSVPFVLGLALEMDKGDKGRGLKARVTMVTRNLLGKAQTVRWPATELKRVVVEHVNLGALQLHVALESKKRTTRLTVESLSVEAEGESGGGESDAAVFAVQMRGRRRFERVRSVHVRPFRSVGRRADGLYSRQVVSLPMGVWRW